jgi:regulatory protein
MEDPAYRKLMDYAMRALSRRAHTTFELSEKLKKRYQYSQPLAAQVIARLQELNLLNDQNYIRTAIEQTTRFRLQGRLKVASRLYKKGISMKETEEIWNSMELPERELALQALERAQKRFARVPQEKLYQKRAQFLASRGFSPEIIFELAKPHENQ